jgi:eukaryotic-like serine/threonine-protein kinase
MESPSRSPVQIGDLVAGKYRIDRVLGAGGMGVVVAAVHEQLDQRVALKFLLPEVSAHTEIVQRFVREARASVRIHSEHVARVLDVGTLVSGVPFMVMEYLEGQDLAQTLLARGPLPVDESVGFLLEACEAVAEAHSLGMVHRDLKPANLFLARRPSGKPTIKVLDFGISKIPVTERDQIVTRTSTVMGSPGYMSPEQMMSSDKVDVRSDIWSLGVVLYELLGQRLPFQGNTMPELIASILQKTHQPLAQVRGDVPIGLANVIDTCLQKEPAGRYANIAELARALAPFGPSRSELSVERVEAVLGVRPISVQPPPLVGPVGASSAPMASATFSPTTSKAAGPPSRLLVPGLALLAFVVIAGIGGVVIVRASHKPATAPIAPADSSSAALTSASVVMDPSPSSPPVASSVTLIAAPPSEPVGPGKVRPSAPVRPSASAAPSSPPSAPQPVPSCHVVSYFDADGNKHFKQECP